MSAKQIKVPKPAREGWRWIKAGWKLRDTDAFQNTPLDIWTVNEADLLMGFAPQGWPRLFNTPGTKPHWAGYIRRIKSLPKKRASK